MSRVWRVGAVVIGAGILVLGALGQPSPTRRLMVGIYTVAGTAGAAVAWFRLRGKEAELTWKRITAWSAVGGLALGLVLGLAGWRMVNTAGEGVGVGLFVGLVLSGINGTFRKTASSELEQETPGGGEATDES